MGPLNGVFLSSLPQFHLEDSLTTLPSKTQYRRRLHPGPGPPPRPSEFFCPLPSEALLSLLQGTISGLSFN